MAIIIATFILLCNIVVLATDYLFVIDTISNASIGSESIIFLIVSITNVLVYFYATRIREQGHKIIAYILITPVYFPLFALVYSISELDVLKIDIRQLSVIFRVIILSLQLVAPILSITSVINRITRKHHNMRRNGT